VRKILITGPKHAGKTSVAGALAQLCRCDWTDLDAALEARSGKTARALYREGLERFKKAEAETLAALLADERLTIIATGGGIIDNNEAVAALRNADAALVYLALPAHRAWERISSTPELPPFLNTETPEETHRALHERRSRAYEALCPYRFAVDHKSLDAICQEIKDALWQ
jgi:shikimate kinase